MPDLSLRGRVLILFSALMLVVVLAGTALMISNARDAVSVEIEASKELAKKLTITAVGALVRSGDGKTVLADLPVQLQQPRHVRIAILNLHNDPIATPVPQLADEHKTEVPAPGWFDALIRPPAEITRVPVVVDGALIGTVVITAEPSDEIAEVWSDLRVLFFLLVCAFPVLLIAVSWTLGRALAPLSTISDGLERLESGDYRAQLPRIPVPDLAQIGVRFNALASQLETTLREKEQLNQQLIGVQDTERKSIALELHDEFGPCLFGIKVDATYIETEARKMDPAAGAELADRARGILDVVDHMQKTNRALLYKLRPMALGHVDLSQLLEDLINGYRLRHPDVQWRLNVQGTAETYGETADLTVYRVVQECLTNTARHADASEVDVELSGCRIPCNTGDSENALPPAVQVTVRDNGQGLAPDAEFGFGLSGMNERVQALGGTLHVEPRKDGGTAVHVQIPRTVIEDEPAVKARTASENA